jgi:dTDP-4-dehydrorhamnose 3,5-epimerase-like enzyme
MSITLSQNTLRDCSLIELPKLNTDNSSISYFENSHKFPFELKRCFYLFDVPANSRRGGHAHKNLHQLIIAAKGSFEIVLDDGYEIRTVSLNQPSYGLHIPPGIWKEIMNFSAGSNCLVLASDLYYEEDYLRDKEKYYRLKREDQQNRID